MASSHAALSDVGKVRSTNQDSGYSGTYLHVVADGMGGHAGGDVASHLVIQELRKLDRPFDSIDKAHDELISTLITANDELNEIVYQQPQLAGLGTTVSALLRVGNQAVIAHIGDSRIYLKRSGSLTQVTVDHTFVQRLIDSGRLTEEEAQVHPRRSVLMRVLGDVEAVPEIDTAILEIEQGDTWMLCSDGLTSVLLSDQLQESFDESLAPAALAKKLVKASLDRGAPDNVTVVICKVTETLMVAPASAESAQIVGSAAKPLNLGDADPINMLITAPRSRPKPRALPVTTGGVKIASPALTAKLDEIKVLRLRRRILWSIVAVAAAGAVVILGILGYRFTQTQYFVGSDTDSVVIYQGIPQDFFGIPLSTPYRDTNVSLTSLTAIQKSRVAEKIPATSLADAEKIVDSLGTKKP